MKKFVNLETVEEKLIQTKAKRVNLHELVKFSDEYSDQNFELSKEKFDILKYEQQEIDSTIEFTQFLLELGKCPTCHSDIENKQIQSIIGG